MSEVVDITKLVENDVAQFLAKSEKKREEAKEAKQASKKTKSTATIASGGKKEPDCDDAAELQKQAEELKKRAEELIKKQAECSDNLEDSDNSEDSKEEDIQPAKKEKLAKKKDSQLAKKKDSQLAKNKSEKVKSSDGKGKKSLKTKKMTPKEKLIESVKAKMKEFEMPISNNELKKMKVIELKEFLNSLKLKAGEPSKLDKKIKENEKYGSKVVDININEPKQKEKQEIENLQNDETEIKIIKGNKIYCYVLDYIWNPENKTIKE